MTRELLQKAYVALDGQWWAQNLCRQIDNALAAPQPEPVAWKCAKCGNTSDCEGVTVGDNWCNSCAVCGEMKPLYATAPPAAPAPADWGTPHDVSGAPWGAPAPAVREPQDERIRWRDAVIKEAESALRTAEQEFADMPTWANVGHAAKKVTHALAVIAALGIGGGGK